MHEFGIVQAIEDQVRQLLREHHAARPTRIVVKASTQDGLSREALMFAFRHMTESAGWTGTDLELQIETRSVPCPNCRQSFEPARDQLFCPQCGGAVTEQDLPSGPVLMSVEME